MVEKRLAAARELVGDVAPRCGRRVRSPRRRARAPARPDRSPPGRRRPRPAGASAARAGQAGEQLARPPRREHVDALDVARRPRPARAASRVVYSTRPRGPVARNAAAAAARPDVVDDQQAPALGERRAQQLEPLARRAQLGRARRPSARAGRSAPRPRSPCSPTVTQNTPSGKCRRTVVVARQRGGQHRLADPALPVQPQRALAGDPDRAVARAPAARRAAPASSSRATYAGGSGGTPCSSPGRSPRAQRRARAPQQPAPPRRDRRRVGSPPGSAGSSSSSFSAHPHDLPLGIARARHRPVAARVVRPLHALAASPTSSHRHGRTSTQTSRTPRSISAGSSSLHDEVRRQERRADQQQRRARATDRLGELRSPLLAHERCARRSTPPAGARAPPA